MKIKLSVTVAIILGSLITISYFFQVLNLKSSGSKVSNEFALRQVLEENISVAPTPYCSEPSVGCGSGYYWNTGTCSCYPNPTPYYCNPPSEGCPYNYYWDSSSCMCKIYQTTTSPCPSPQNGCGGNYYWDSSTCSCRLESTTSSCTQPSGGCGSNYYWDSSSCSCKINPSVTPCYPSSGSCSSNTYWDNYSCSCKSYYPYYQQENFDRLAYESSERINCVKTSLTSYEYERLRFLVPTNQSEQDEITRLGSKVVTCWGTTAPETTHVTSQIKTPLGQESCLIGKIGENRYREINQGLIKPTYEEHLKYEKCFGEFSPSTVTYYKSEDEFPQETDVCLRTTLGELYTRIKSGQAEVPYELKEKVNRCFGVNPQAFEEGRVYILPDNIKNCLIQEITEPRYNDINSGRITPTSYDKDKAKSCFDQLNSDQFNFLPIPPEQVHFLDTDPETINISVVKQDTNKIDGQIFGGKVVFAGKSTPNSVVNIYIYTEPIVVTTKTDENGEFIYELTQPLKGENHIAYATVRDPSGKIVKSQVFNFNVIAAEDDLQKGLLSERGVEESARHRFITISFAVVVSALLIVISGYAFYNFKKIKKTSVSETGDQTPI